MGPVVGRGVPGEEEIHRSNKDGNSARQEGGGGGPGERGGGGNV